MDNKLGELLNQWDEKYSKTSTDDKYALGEIYMRAQTLYTGSGYETPNSILSKLEFALSTNNKGWKPTTKFAIGWAQNMIEAMKERAAIYHLAD